MQRFLPYLGIVGAIALAVLIGTLNTTTVFERPSPIESEFTELTVLPQEIQEPLALATSSPVEEVATTTPSAKPKATKPAPKTAVKTVEPQQTVAVVPSPENVITQSELEAASSALRGALVNIICSATFGSRLHSISGTGVFVDSKGFILTNAHIAQYFLLKDRGMKCVVRTGSPARDTYTAGLAYISSSWLKANPGTLTADNPTGDGQYDFAVIAVTGSANGLALPQSFPHLPLSQGVPAPGVPIVIGSYGAQFLESSQIQSSLFPTIVFGSVKELFTFNSNTAAVISLGGSAAAQEGSSGGGVALPDGTLAGTITTSTIEGATSSRNLNAISEDYIRRAYLEETGNPFSTLFDQKAAQAIAAFAPKTADLEAIITQGL